MKKSPPPKKVRIIGGFWRSRLVPVIEEAGLRPSTDRVRETLFNWLGPSLEGSRCLDLFAGTGVLGLEACSRGALHVTFVESNPKIFLNLEKTIATLQPLPPNCSVDLKKMDALKWLRMQSQIDYDVLFIDPPFESPSLLSDALKTLGEFHKKTLRTIMYVESPVRLENAAILNDLPGWSIERQLVAGAVKASLLKQLVKE